VIASLFLRQLTKINQTFILMISVMLGIG